MRARENGIQALVDRLMSLSLESTVVRAEPPAGESYVQLW